MKKYLTWLLLAAIIALAVILRLYKLGDAPRGFYVDEAGQGYSAYSILKTGKDEFGKPFPIIFRSLTDFKTPVYIYLVVPLIPVFGLNPFTVRFPSFLFSIITIPILYFLTLHLTKNKNLSLLSSLLLAISPWHILFGRTNFECNVALFFLITGIFCFFKALKNPRFLIVSALMFGVAIPSYHSQRIITPLIMLLLFFRYKKILFSKTHLNYLVVGAIVGLIILLPTLSVAFTPGFLARASGLNIFSHSRQMPDGFLSTYSGIFNPLVNGSWFLSTREFLSLYFSYLSPRYMFVLGDYGPRSSFPGLSTFYIWQLPFYLWGFWVIFRNKENKDFKFIVLSLLLVSPIPAAVTRDPYTTIRALPLVVPQILIISLGIIDLYQKIKSKFWKFLAVAGFAAIVTYSILKLYSSVIILNEYYRGKFWDFGWKEVVSEIQKTDPNIPVVIDNARSDPDLEIAFFLKYEPIKYQAENYEVALPEYYTNLKRNREKHIGRVTTRPIEWINDLLKDEILVGDELAISQDQIKTHKLTLLKEIYFPDGTVAFRIVRTNPAFERESRRAYNNKSI